MPQTKRPLYDTRKNFPKGIEWKGWLYEHCKELSGITNQFGYPKERIMIVEDNDDHLIVSDYSSGSWHDQCKPVGPLYRVNRIAAGRPNQPRIDNLKEAVRVANQLLREASGIGA